MDNVSQAADDHPQDLSTGQKTVHCESVLLVQLNICQLHRGAILRPKGCTLLPFVHDIFNDVNF
jgi:hypothetical protein